jgi:hypothetical protein
MSSLQMYTEVQSTIISGQFSSDIYMILESNLLFSASEVKVLFSER